MCSMIKNSAFNCNMRRAILMLSLLAVAIPIVAEEPLRATAPASGQIRERLGERIQDRREQRGPRERRTADETHQIAGLNVAVWRPSQRLRAPLIVFSHGFKGCNTQSMFLMEAMADAGYLVVAPNHKDSICNEGSRGGRPEERFGRASDWNDRTYADRRDDINRLVDALRQDRQWSSQINWSGVGLVGHSLGGYTVLGLAGGWPSWRMPLIKAVLALSPYCEPYALKGDLGGIRIPVMYQGGTRDIGVTPSLRKEGGCYSETSSPSFFVEFERAGHFAWTNAMDTHHDIIIRYSLAFLDRYVRGLPWANPTLRLSGVRDLRAK